MAADLVQFALALEQHEINPWFDETINKMLSIYANHPDNDRHGVEQNQELERIGKMFNERGGKRLMRHAHAEFVLCCKAHNLRDRSGYISAPRSLEHRWNGIGEWMS